VRWAASGSCQSAEMKRRVHDPRLLAARLAEGLAASTRAWHRERIESLVQGEVHGISRISRLDSKAVGVT